MWFAVTSLPLNSSKTRFFKNRKGKTRSLELCWSLMLRRTVIALLCCLILAPGLLGHVLALRETAGASPAQDFSPQAATLIINEYLADPPAAGGDANGDGAISATNDEFVEIVNSGASALNVGGFTISDATQVRFTFPAGKMIPAGEAAVIFGGGTPTGSFGNASANGLVFTALSGGLSLNNTGDTITIKDNTSVVVDTLTFTSVQGNADQSITRSPDVTGGFVNHSTATGSGGALFSPGAKADGSTFTPPNPLISSISPAVTIAGSGNVPLMVAGSNFQMASMVVVDGSPISTSFQNANLLNATVPPPVTNSPGAHSVIVENPGPVGSNSKTFTVLAGLGINEYLANGSAGDANGDGAISATQDEFVEIINRTSSAANVGGFTISDADSVRFTFPAGTIIPANEVAVIFGGGTPTGDFGNARANGLVFTATLSLNNTGDTISLKDSGSIVVESITYGSSEGGAAASITRSPDVTGDFALHSTAPGSGGALFSPGTRIDGTTFTPPNPLISTISPTSTIAGSGDVPLTVNGSHFQMASIVRVDGSPISTTFQNANLLNATIPAAVTNVPGPHSVTVENPGPAGSNAKTFTVLPGVGINEYLADPPDGAAGDANGDGVTSSSQDEFVEVINRTSVAANVGGFTISDADSVRFTFPPGTIIPANEVAVIFGGGTPAGEFGNARANGLVFTATLSLNNDSDTISLKDSATNVIESVTYGAAEGGANQSITRSPDVNGNFAMHSTAPGSGGRLFSPGTRLDGSIFTAPNPLISSIAPDSAAAGSGVVPITVNGNHFDASAHVRVDGSPIDTTFQNAMQLTAAVPASVTNVSGAHTVTVENPGPVLSNAVTFTVLSAVGINEYLADPPDGAAGDANGDGVTSSSQDEFVEVINRTSLPVDIGGYSISDADSLRFTFPSGTILPANEAAIIFGGGTPTGDFGNARLNGLVFTATLSLNNTGDTISLKDNGSNIVESITYGSSEGGANQSITRSPDGTGTFVTHSTAAGSGGRLFSPGTRVDGSPFTVGPRITSIAPVSAPKDDPPFEITVMGSGFDSTADVLIDGSPVTRMFVGAGELKALVPASVTAVSGPHQVRVRNEGGNRSNIATLTIIPPPPFLSDLRPRLVTIGSGQFTLFIAGLNYDSASVVLVEGTPVSTTFVDTHELRALVPASFVTALGTRRVVVRNSDGRQSNQDSFDVIPAATVLTSLFPTSVRAGAPGFTLSIKGANLKSGASVTFDKTQLDSTFISASEVRVDVPASLITSVGIRAVSVRNPGEASSNELIFFVLPDPPIIALLDPSGVLAGSGDVMVTVNGSKFQRGAVVRVIEDTRRGAALDTTFISGAQVKAKVPASLTEIPGVVLLGVENPDGGLSNAAPLRIFIKDPLVINEYLADPPEGSAGDANGDGTRSSSSDEFIEILNRNGEPLDISGYTISDADALRHVFAAGTILPAFEATVVFGGGTPTGAFGNASENHLVFKASSGGLSLNNGGDTITLRDAHGVLVQEIKFGAAEGGAGQSLNRDPDGDGSTFTLHAIVAESFSRLFSPGTRANGATFTIKPAISLLTPASVRVGALSFSLVVTGSKFLPGAVVLLGTTPLATVFRSDSQLEAQVPANLVAIAGAVEIRVRNPRGELSSASRLVITDDPPRISGITPQVAGTGADKLEVTITGERFQQGAVVFVQGSRVETRFISATSLSATLPGTLLVRAAELPVLVENIDGNRSNTLMLTVENGPLITRLSKGRVKAGRGVFDLTLGGVAFKQGIVLFVNDAPVSTTFVSEFEFTARISAELTAQPGVLMLQARHPNGGRSNMVKFKVVQ